MKKIILALIVCLTIINSNAQESESEEATKNPTSEIKLNALFMVIGAFDVTYEYLLNDESGVGLEVFVPFDDDIKDDIDYYISPYYRMYFGKKYASGFFLEGFGLLSTTTVSELTFFDNQGFVTRVDREKETNFALGIGFGGKWYTKSGFVGELGLGVGRNIIDSEFENEFVGKIAITIGYRF